MRSLINKLIITSFQYIMENLKDNQNPKKPIEKKDDKANPDAKDPKDKVEGSDVDYPADESPYADLNTDKNTKEKKD
jgi:hypothetical protein